MRSQRAAASALLGALIVANACTTDFTGYHLASAEAGAPAADAGAAAADAGAAAADAGAAAADAGAPAADAGAAGSGDGDPAAGTGGSTASAGASAGGSDALGGSAAGTSTGGTSALGGGAGEPLSGGTGGSGTPIVLLSGTPPSCQGLASACGPEGTSNCCAASLVPGGAYNRSDQVAAPATVSDFGLDEYEVSVGRFRNFVQGYTQTMIGAGAGKNPNGSSDSGWSTDWNLRLPATASALVSAVTSAGCGTMFTYTADPGAHESWPMTCLTWYEAFAFCAWDGGRLPTEAEWNYAAAAGKEERAYPWGNAAPDITRAVFQPASLQPVGSKGQRGSSNWGQLDMAGNAWEWTLDVYAPTYIQTSCQDCANTTTAVNSPRVFRGGSAGNSAGFLLAATRNSYDPSKTTGYIGARCARTP